MLLLMRLFYWILHNTIFFGPFWMFLLIAVAAKVIYILGFRFYRKKSFPAKIAKRLEECDQTFNFDVKIDDISQAMRDKLLKVDLQALKEMIWSKEISSEQVLKFYFYRSKTIGRELKAAIEANFEESLKLAKKADELIRTKKREELPVLCGLPFSVKENYFMKGFELTGGAEPRLGVKEDKTAPLIEHLVSLGAIPFVRSNVPQFLMCSESENPVYGICQNPHDKSRTPGGSSGGEGALIGAGCSPIGLGNDIGGSIRIPATFSGIFGFKPTAGRFNVEDHSDEADIYREVGNSQEYIKCCNGPMGRSVEDLLIFTEHMAHPQLNYLKHRELPPLPWRKDATQLPQGKKLTIGYFESLDETFECHPAGRRAVREVVEALKKEGHTLVKIELPNTMKIFGLAMEIFTSDGSAKGFFDFKNGVTMIKAYKEAQILYNLPRWLRLLVAKILKWCNMHRLSALAASNGPIKARDYFIKGNEQNAITRQFQESLLMQNIEYIISPGFGTPALKHHTSGDLILAAVYTVIYNFMGMPAGTLPVTKITKEEQFYESQHKDMITDLAKECLKDSEGLPVGVQVVAMPWKDEECLALMKYIESIMGLKPFLKY